MDHSLILIYIISVFVLIATPGPVVALIINTSMNAGGGQALRTAVGTNVASLLLALLAVLILSGSVSLNPALLNWISFFGCWFIVYLAVQGLRSSPDATSPAVAGGMGTGFLVGISNPKDIIFFVSFFPQFIHVADSFSASMTLLTTLWVIIDLLILALYILAARQPFALKYRRGVNRVACFVLLAVAIAGIAHSGKALWG